MLGYLSWRKASTFPARSGVWHGPGLKGRPEESEPAREVGLDRQLLLELRLQLELLGVVTFLALPGRNERPERAALVPVDPEHRQLAAGEPERRREQLLAKASCSQLRGDQMNRRHEVLEVVIAHDQPLVAV